MDLDSKEDIPRIYALSFLLLFDTFYTWGKPSFCDNEDY
ncbi:hypothetical protein V6Z11_A02G177800 [Gossypium hirsutum]